MGALPWVFYPFVKPGRAVLKQYINLTLRGFLEVGGEEEAGRWREALVRAMLRDAARRSAGSEPPCGFGHDQEPGHSSMTRC